MATTEDILRGHKDLYTACEAHRGTGFTKDNNAWYGCKDKIFRAGQQTECYNINSLLRAIIIVIDNFHTDFENLQVRLVRTGVTSGLRKPITWEGLTIAQKINDDEVTTSLREAIQFIMALDQRETSEKRDNTVLDYTLGKPAVDVKRFFSNPSLPRSNIWRGTEKDIPVGPSTNWWKEVVASET